MYLIQSQWRLRGYFFPELQFVVFRERLWDSRSHLLTDMQNAACLITYVQIFTPCWPLLVHRVSVPGMQKQHVVLFSCHALSPYVACSGSVVNCPPYLSSRYFIPVTGISSSMTVCSGVNFYLYMSFGWILCSALNMVFPFWVCGWLSEGNSQELCYTSEISTCEWSRSNLCGPDGLDSMKPQNIS